MSNQILKKTVLYFIGNFSSKLIAILLIPIYAYFVSTEDLGNYDFIIAIMNILIPIMFINLWDSILKYILNNSNEKEINSYITSSVFLLISNIFIFSVVFFILYRFNFITYRCSILSFIMMISFGLYTFWQYLSRALGYSSLYVVSGVLSSFINIISLSILVVFLKRGLGGLIISYILAMLIPTALMETKVRVFARLHRDLFNFEKLIEMFKFSFPITLNTISLWGISSISKIICVTFLNSSANGIYSFASKFGSLVTVFGSIISAVLIEQAYLQKTIEEYRKNFSKIIQKIMYIYLLIIFISIPLINIIFTLFWKNTPYYVAKSLVPFTIFSAIFGNIASSFGSAFQVTGSTNKIFLTSLMGALISVITSLVLIDKMGILGLVVSQLIGNITLMGIRSFYAYKETGLKISWKNNIFIIIVECIVFSIILQKGIIINIVIEIIILIIVSIVSKEYIKNLLFKIYRR